MGQENAAVGALPLRIGGREMLADIAQAGGAEQCIGDGVEHDVGIAVAGETAIMRDGNPAHHDRPFAGKGVDVEAHAGRGDQPRAGQIASARVQSAACVSLSSIGSPSTDATSASGGAHDRSIRRSG